MDEVDRAREMVRRHLLEAAREQDSDKAKLLVCVANTWLEVLSALEHRQVWAGDLITVDQLMRGLGRVAQS